MKIPRIQFLIVLTILVSILLSSCSGAGLINSWPGVSSDESLVYLAEKGTIYAVNASNGTLAWQFPAEKPDASKPFFAAPAVTEDMIVVGNYGHQLFALDKNGAPLWQGPFDSQSGYFVATPLVVNDLILAPSSNETLYALDRTGKKLWEYKTENMLWATPASDGNYAFLPGLDHHLYALTLSQGKEVWRADLGAPLLSAPLLVDKTLYVSTLDGEVVALNTGNGTILWRAKTDGRLWSSPALGEDVLYVGTMNNKIAAISAQDGTVLWQKDSGGPVFGSVLVRQDSIVFVTETRTDSDEAGKVAAWSLDGQSVLWEQPVTGKLYTAPVLASESLVVGLTQSSDKKLLQAFGVNGQISWPFIPGN